MKVELDPQHKEFFEKLADLCSDYKASIFNYDAEKGLNINIDNVTYHADELDTWIYSLRIKYVEFGVDSPKRTAADAIRLAENEKKND